MEHRICWEVLPEECPVKDDQPLQIGISLQRYAAHSHGAELPPPGCEQGRTIPRSSARGRGVDSAENGAAITVRQGHLRQYPSVRPWLAQSIGDDGHDHHSTFSIACSRTPSCASAKSLPPRDGRHAPRDRRAGWPAHTSPPRPGYRRSVRTGGRGQFPHLTCEAKELCNDTKETDYDQSNVSWHGWGGDGSDTCVPFTELGEKRLSRVGVLTIL